MCTLANRNRFEVHVAAKSVVERAAKRLRDLRVAEVAEQDLVIEGGKVTAYRTKVKISFKYHGEE